MIFADASALIAILAQEPDAAFLGARLRRERPRLFSAVSRWETITGLCRSYKLDPILAAADVDFFLRRLGFDLVLIGAKEAELAVEAMRIYGKGRHPAALNMGDCFAYACAKAAGASLLYKGGDFALTDLA